MGGRVHIDIDREKVVMVGNAGGVVVEGLLSGRELFSLSRRWIASLAFAFVLQI